MNPNQTQIKFTNGQIIASSLFIISIAISIILLYNNKLLLEQKPPILTEQESKDIALFNKAFALFLLLYFLYVSIEEYQERKGSERESDSLLQVIASLLVVIAACITGYVLLKNYNQNISPEDIFIDNPEI